MKLKNLIAVILSFLLVLTGCSSSNESVSSDLEIHIIDIGQGDSILIKTPEGNTMLVDTGPYSSYETLNSYLIGQNINKFDYALATHPDADHIGSFSEVIQNNTIEEFHMPEKSHTSTSYELMMESLESKQVPIKYIEAGYSFNISPTVKATYLNPFSYTDGDNNNYSAVLIIQHGENKFLLTGDAEAPDEENIINNFNNIQADILKIGHHGSSTSSTKEFLQAVNPSYAVVSCEYKNKFGHPHEETVSLLEEMNIPLYRTDEQGTVIFYSDGENIYVNQKSAGSYEPGNSK